MSGVTHLSHCSCYFGSWTLAHVLCKIELGDSQVAWACRLQHWGILASWVWVGTVWQALVWAGVLGLVGSLVVMGVGSLVETVPHSLVRAGSQVLT